MKAGPWTITDEGSLLQTTLEKYLIIGLMAIWLCASASAEGVPCWLRCHHPPAKPSAETIACVLRGSSNPQLKLLARVTGLFTTYAGKILGIQGWKDYHLTAQVDGTVVQVAGSTDGLYTIDVSIKQLKVADRLVTLAHPSSFIRVEVFPFVRIGAHLPRHAKDSVCISGKLMWDADGFLEIHPQQAVQIQTVCSP